MSDSLIHTIYLAAAFLALFGSAEWMYHRLQVQAEVTRKYVHMVTGFLSLLFPPLIGNHWYVLLLCGSFLLILMLSIQLQILPSINKVDRITRGSILYPVIVYGCYLIYGEYGHITYYYVPLVILAVCDPVAGLIGRRWPKGKYTTFGNTKTLSGSASFFAAAMTTCLLLMITLEKFTLQEAFITSFALALLTTIAEALTHKGYDNLTIPMSAILVLLALNEWV